MKRITYTFVILLSLLLATHNTPAVKTQAPFWVGLNLNVEFRNKGIVTVVLKQHPFDNYGNSLISDEEIVNEILQEEGSIVESSILLFALTPYRVRYNITSKARVEPQESVMCNVGTFGGMKIFEGAIILSFDLLLNTTGAIQELKDDIYQVIVTDFFTLSDPRSWLDVVEFQFLEDVALLNFSWDPSWARPPTIRTGNNLLWVNENEADAPDHYLLTLIIPGVVFSKVSLRTKAEISDIEVSAEDLSLSVRIRNVGDDLGTFIIRVLEGGYDQARKVSLAPADETRVKFPLHIVSGKALIQVIGEDNVLLDERQVDVQIASIPQYYGLLRILAYALLAAGIIAIILFLRDLRRKGVPPPPTPLPYGV
ncbi:MAG: hypothetical protein QXF26_07770 [Candidatus Bathyarchaeia archaeon]